MEANFFRHAARELAPRITGMRIEKIFDPASGILTIDLGSPGYLILHASPSRGFFFLSSTKPDNKERPSGQVMWLRKRTRSHRIQQVLTDWPSRRMAWLMDTRPPMYLMVDLRQGVSLVRELDPHFGREPDWPDMDALGSQERIWETYPQITPPVRHRLHGMEPNEAREFLDGLRRGTPPSSFWILGEPQRARLSLWPDPSSKGRAFPTALAAAESYGSYVVASMVNGEGEKKRIISKRLRHLKKALSRVQRDRVRLENMIAGKEHGRLLQAHLYHLDGSARLDSVCLDDGTGRMVTLDLDPSLTVLENMARFFARARKGERGLPLVEARKQVLVGEMEQVRTQGESPPTTRQTTASPAPGIPGKYRSLAVNLYRTSDGFLLIRGRNQKANHRLLSQLAGSQDYWFHAQDGPGAHVILKRDFSTQKVPRTSLEQAAIIAALSSWQKNAAKAQVMWARVKHVRKIKGAAQGQVLVDQVEESLLVDMDPSLEKRLRIKA
jgi:predicted ribosome quality control (RQC) complex YloA/Tae2 family protein